MSALTVGLLCGLLGAGLFTFTCVGLAFAALLPVIFFSTMTACFLFLCGLGGYYILRWVNGGQVNSDSSGDQIGGTTDDRHNALAGGRLAEVTDSMRVETAKSDINGFLV